MPDFDDSRLMTPVGTGRAGQIRSASVAVRAAPKDTAEMVTQALFGETLQQFDSDGDFVQVQLDRDRYVGWVHADALAEAGLTATHRVSTLRTHAYAEPNIKSAPVVALPLGARVRVTGDTENGFAQCGDAGWVPDRHLRTVDDVDDDPAAIAETFRDAPYLWGGRETSGIDCTGLTVAAFGACGVTLPRDSDMQFAWVGTPIEDWSVPGALQRSDLVFWKGHVGIMLDDACFLHANAHHMAVASEPLSEAIERIARLYGDPIGARRIDIEKARRETPAWLVSVA